MPLVDLVLPFITSRSQDIELRFALRSLERFATGVGNIWVIGDNPGFLRPPALHVPCPIFHGMPKDSRIALQLLWCFDRCHLTSPTCLWNDDFILTQEIEVRTIQPFHKGITLWDAAVKHRSRTYSATLKATALALQQRRAPTWHYDLHAPILYEPQKFRSLWQWWSDSARSPAGYVVKSIYQNLFGDEKRDPVMEDLKCHKFLGPQAHAAAIQDRWIYSYNNLTLKTGLNNYLQNIYPEKSCYEI